MKRCDIPLLAFAFFFLNLLLLCSPPCHAAQSCKDAPGYVPLEQRYTRGLLFKIEKCGEPVSYLFGTVHLGRPEILRAAKDAFNTLSSVDAAGFEIAMPGKEMQEAARRYLLAPNKSFSLSHALGEKEYNKFRVVLKPYGLTPERYEHLSPWVVSVILELVGEDDEEPLDEKLQQKARDLGKPVFGLETLKEQLEIFSGLSMDLQMRMLRESIDEHDYIVKLKREMIQAYLNHDIIKIGTLEAETVSGDDPGLDAIIDEKLLTSRNHTMEKRLLPMLNKQSVLVAVGAMHLVGKEGLLHLLEQEGYRITPIP